MEQRNAMERHAMERRDALTELVRLHVGDRGRDGKLTVRAFCAKAKDPDTGYSPSVGLIGSILAGDEYIKVTPQLISALAVGLSLPRRVVAAAAHLQLLGYEKVELAGDAPATLLKVIGPGADDTTDADVARSVAERWVAEAEPGVN